MHGRVKVYTTEEERAKKNKECQQKLQVYKLDMQKIFHKRDEGELDEDLLELTGKVLSSNPDIYTLWNIRKEILSIFKKKLKDENEEKLSQLFDAELVLTKHCFTTHPKSYPAWYHRQWVLTNRADPNWEEELALCNIHLKLDERNFHTWDHRRFVVGQSKKSLEEEFDFTTQTLFENFSNYSAWHYRSNLLVDLHPDTEGGRPIEDVYHSDELKMVLSASFTDPDDSSAWFYQRWLLEGAKKHIAVAVYVVKPFQMTVSFSQPVNQSFVSSRTHLFFNNVLVHGDWQSYSGNQYNVLWFFKHNADIIEGLHVQMEYDSEDGNTQVIPGVKHNLTTYVGKGEIDFKKKYSQPVAEELNKQLDTNRQLLVMVPDDKWTLLTVTCFLHCIDAKQYHKETIENLHKLKSIDDLRAGYYDDLITKWSIEDQLTEDYKRNDLDFKIMFDDKITSLPHLQYYSHCENVDLSNQSLRSNVLPSLELLQNCKKLSLEDNQLTTLKGFPYLNLEVLNLKGNNDLAEEEVEFFKIKCNYSVIF